MNKKAIEVGDKMLFLTCWPNGELVPVTIIGEHEFMPGIYRFRKPDGRTDFTKPDFLFDLPENVFGDCAS